MNWKASIQHLFAAVNIILILSLASTILIHFYPGLYETVCPGATGAEKAARFGCGLEGLLLLYIPIVVLPFTLVVWALLALFKAHPLVPGNISSQALGVLRISLKIIILLIGFAAAYIVLTHRTKGGF